MNSSLDQYLNAIVKLTSNMYYYSKGEKFVYGIVGSYCISCQDKTYGPILTRLLRKEKVPTMCQLDVMKLGTDYNIEFATKEDCLAILKMLEGGHELEYGNDADTQKLIQKVYGILQN